MACNFARRANVSHDFRVASSGKSPADSPASRPFQEGRIAIVTSVGSGMRWLPFHQAHLRKTTDATADGEIVWS